MPIDFFFARAHIQVYSEAVMAVKEQCISVTNASSKVSLNVCDLLQSGLHSNVHDPSEACYNLSVKHRNKIACNPINLKSGFNLMSVQMTRWWD